MKTPAPAPTAKSKSAKQLVNEASEIPPAPLAAVAPTAAASDPSHLGDVRTLRMYRSPAGKPAEAKLAAS